MAGLVRHYQNTMKGIPQLTNNWGAMITLLDAVLVNGFNHVPILSLSKSNQTSITATINLGSGHGFIDRQVVRIAGSTNGWDGDYKVLSADSASITIECTAEHPSATSGTASCFTAPLDFEIAYQTPVDSIEPKRAYRSTDPESLGLILLVHDFCVSGASATGAKFAKVGVVSDMSDIDVIIGNQMPFDEANPNANWGWDGTYHGRAKWYYRTSSASTFADSAVATAGNTPFIVVGNSKSFAIETRQGAAFVYGFFEFYDHILKSQNLCLMAQGAQTAVSQSTEVTKVFRGAYNLANDAILRYGALNKNLRGLIWFGSDGVFASDPCGLALCFGFGVNGRVTDLLNIDLIAPLPITVNRNGLDQVIGQFDFLKMTASKKHIETYIANVGKAANRFASDGVGLEVRYAITMEIE